MWASSDVAERLEIQASGGHDDVGLEFAPGFQPDAPLGERIDPISDH
jgi:hypothetical protein